MMRFRAVANLLLIVGLFYTGIACASDFTRVKQMLLDKQAEKAYQVLLQEEDHHLGEPDYDIMLGRAALESGHFHEAIFAYERVLLAQPANINAQLGMAIAHFRIQEYERARQLFDEIQRAKPPQKLRELVGQYLDAIIDKQDSLLHKFNSRITIRKGVDSNINSATDNTSIDFGPATLILGEASRATEDTYTELDGNFGYTYTLTNNHNLFANLNIAKRGNHHHPFDTYQTALQVGAAIQTPIGLLRVPFTAHVLELDNKEFRQMNSIAATLSGDQTAARFFSGNLQISQIRYPEQTTQDVDMVSGGLGYVITNSNKSLRMLASLYFGDESVKTAGYDFNAKQFYGLQAKWFYRLTKSQMLEARLLHQQVEYKGETPLLAVTRDEQFQSYALTWRWWLTKSLNLEAKLEGSKNDSNTSLYDYSRTVISSGISLKI